MPYDTRAAGTEVSPNAPAFALGRLIGASAVVTLALFRCAFLRVLWADEDYHMAAAIDWLHGLIPYRDFWYDKPPLAAVYYALIGAWTGWPLRLLDAVYVTVAAFLLYRLARALWSEWEGIAAALAFTFFMTFYLPSAVIPFAADALLIVPHVAAVYCAQQRQATLSGMCAGVGFLINTKAVFVLAACAVWTFPALLRIGAGFAILPALALGAGFAAGAWPGYLEQVWRWGLAYAAASPEAHPYRNGLLRTVNWSLFHSILLFGAIRTFLRRDRHRIRLALWLVLSFAGVAAGMRFEPRYFLQLLPPAAAIAARGLVLLWQRYRVRALLAYGVLLLIPMIRFGPHYVTLAADDAAGRESRWADLSIDEDSAHVATRLKQFSHPGDTLFVWGYRPDIYAYTRMLPASRFWDSQPLTGVPADRHLHSAQAVISAGAAAANRRELAKSHPAFLVDALSLYNPALRLDAYPELRPWLAQYKEIGRTPGSIIYRNRNPALPPRTQTASDAETRGRPRPPRSIRRRISAK